MKFYKSNSFLAVLIFSVSVARTLWVLNQTVYANGWDAYFYLDQIKHWFEHGSLHTDRTSLYYPFLIALRYISGNYVLSYKLGVALCTAAISITAFHIGRIGSESRWIGGCVAVYIISSPHIGWFGANYAKNYLGITFFMVLVLALVKDNWKIALPLFFANLVTHKLTAVLAIIAGIIYLFGRLDRKYIKYVLAGLLLLIGAGFVYLQLYPRQVGFITSDPQFALNGFFETRKSEMSPGWKAELIVLFVLTVFAIPVWIFWDKNQDQPRKFLFRTTVVLFVFLLNPFLQWDLMGYSYRLFLLFPFVSVLLLSVVRKYQIIWMISLVALCLVNVFSEGYNAQLQDPPYAIYDKMIRKLESKKPEIDLIIAPKPVSEYLSFHLGVDVMPWLPEYEVKKERKWRIATGLSEKQLEFYLNGEGFSKLALNYFLLSEAIWQTVLTRVETDDQDLFMELNQLNPSQKRPPFLMK